MIKTTYKIGDPVWIHGISQNNKLIKGKVIQELDLSLLGYLDGPHYIIAIPSSIEDLLEIRTWETMSQDDQGPVGSLRNLEIPFESTNKKLRQAGYSYAADDLIIDEPTPDQIHAAIERTSKEQRHDGLIQKPKRKFYNKKRKL